MYNSRYIISRCIIFVISESRLCVLIMLRVNLRNLGGIFCLLFSASLSVGSTDGHVTSLLNFCDLDLRGFPDTPCLRLRQQRACWWEVWNLLEAGPRAWKLGHGAWPWKGYWNFFLFTSWLAWEEQRPLSCVLTVLFCVIGPKPQDWQTLTHSLVSE